MVNHGNHSRTPSYWKKAKKHLSETDHVFADIIAQFPSEILCSRGNAFETLARSITGQQISVKAADSIWTRVESLMPEVEAEQLLCLEEEALRTTGLSRQKVVYLQGIAKAFVQGNVPYEAWKEASEKEIKTCLTSIKGIGPWTAEMFMIFYLLKPDVLPLADIGLQKAIQKFYGNHEALSIHQMQIIAEPWRPYRTVATWYLWRSLDPVPVVY